MADDLDDLKPAVDARAASDPAISDTMRSQISAAGDGERRRTGIGRAPRAHHP
jgi:hypothetical protein